MSYSEKLRDPRWQRKRLKVMEAAEFKCVSCDAADKTLNVHHRIYRHGKNPWEYADSELDCLCEDCHRDEHALHNRLKEALAAYPSGLDAVVGFVETLALQEGVYEKIPVSSFEGACGIAAAIGTNDPDSVIGASADGYLDQNGYLSIIHAGHHA